MPYPRLHLVAAAAALLLAGLPACGPASEDEALSRTERLRLAADPRAVQFLMDAQQAMEQGAFNAALILADSAQRYAPELADVPFLRARILAALSREDQADAAYRRVLELDPSYRGAWLNLGNASYRSGRFAEALRQYRNELDVAPTPDAWHAIGRTYEQQRQPDSARYAYEQSLALDSTYAVAYLRLGQLHKQAGEIEEAIALSRKGLSLEPDNLDYQYALGSLLILSGQYDEEAVHYLQAVVGETPWHYWANYNLGRVLMRLGRREEGQHYLDRADDLQERLAAIQFWQNLAHSNPDQLMLWVKLAEALRQSGRDAEAQEADQVATSLAPRYMVHRFPDEGVAEAHRKAGIDLLNGNPEAATERYRMLLQEHPGLVDVWLNLGVAYAVSGHPTEAREAWQAALRRQPDNPVAEGFLIQMSQSHIQAETQPPGGVEF